MITIIIAIIIIIIIIIIVIVFVVAKIGLEWGGGGDIFLNTSKSKTQD